MHGWHITAGLTGLALVGAALAPGLVTSPFGVPSEPHVPVLVPPAPLAEPPPAPLPEPGLAAEGVTLEAALDRTAVLTGVAQDRLLTVRLTAPDGGIEQRRPVDLSVVIDASGSMAAEGKMVYARQAAKLLASSMTPEDTFSLIVFDSSVRTIVPASHIQDPAAVHRAIDRIGEGGSTNLYGGIDVGVQQVQASLQRGSMGRVIVLSDGQANHGITAPRAFADLSARSNAHGVTVSTVGLGLDYNEDLLARISDLGGGSYDFVDDPSTLSAVFQDELNRTTAVFGRRGSVDIIVGADVEPVELVGWEGVRIEGGWRVPIGDLHASQTRQIVAKVRVRGTHDGPIEAATATATWTDVTDDLPRGAVATATATVSSDVAIVTASVNPTATVHANRAVGNHYLDLSARAYADGNRDEASRLLGLGYAVVEEAAAYDDGDALDGDLDDFKRQDALYQNAAPSSREGKWAVKSAKEKFRGRAR